MDHPSPLLEGPQSLSGRDLSENLKVEAQFKKEQGHVTKSFINLRFRG